MKRKGTSKETFAKYVSAFMAIKNEIDGNPKTKKITKIASDYNIGHQPITQLKKLGVINQTKNGLFWVGETPSIRMVVQITESIHQYHAELRIRKQTTGDLFERRKRKKIIGGSIQNSNPERGLVDDEHITISSGTTSIPGDQFNWPKPEPCMKTIEQIAETPISELNGDDLKRWHESYSKQIGEKSGIPIKTPPVDSSMVSEFVDHHEQSFIGVESIAKPFQTKEKTEPKLNWFQRLIKAIFNIK